MRLQQWEKLRLAGGFFNVGVSWDLPAWGGQQIQLMTLEAPPTGILPEEACDIMWPGGWEYIPASTLPLALKTGFSIFK
jgi:hypothetical protein